MSNPTSGPVFAEASLLKDGEPIAIPIGTDVVFAAVSTFIKTDDPHDGIAVVYFCLSNSVAYDGPTDAQHSWLGVLDWDYRKFEVSTTANWIPSIDERLTELASEHKARGNDGIYFGNGGMTAVLASAARRAGIDSREFRPDFSALGRDERVMSIANSVHRGHIKFGRHAHDKEVVYKGDRRNHLLNQIRRFRVGAKPGETELLDAFSAGIYLAFPGGANE